MQVSAITMNYYQAYYNQKINSRGNDSTDVSTLNLTSQVQKNDNQEKLFESINEWKEFCHHQIEQGKLDIFA